MCQSGCARRLLSNLSLRQSLHGSCLQIPTHILYHTDDSFRRFEQLMNAKKGKKKKKDRADMMIASIVLANDALLITRNVTDYEGINGLRVENWAD